MRIVLVLMLVVAAGVAGARLLARGHHEKGAFQAVAETERDGLLLHANVVGAHGVVTVRATITNRGARTARLVAGRCGRVTSAALRAGGSRRRLSPTGACASARRTVRLRPGAAVDERWQLPAGPRLSAPGAHFEVRVSEPGGTPIHVDAPASATPPAAKAATVELAAESSLPRLYCHLHDLAGGAAGDPGRSGLRVPDGSSEQ